MAILHNISFDTVNCSCCINREDARVPADIINKGYWICKQKEGAFPKKPRELRRKSEAEETWKRDEAAWLENFD